MNRWDVHFNHSIDTRENRLIELFVKIESFKLSVLKIPLPPALKKKIDQLNIIRQIKGTTGIEGINLSDKEIEGFINQEFDEKQEHNRRQKEGLNSTNLINFIRESTKADHSGIITENLVKQIHYISTVDIDYDHNIPGVYRGHSAFAGDGSIIYPDHEKIDSLMKQFIEFINSREAMALGGLIRAILAHFYLISIHPFGDGNGRTSRGLEAFILFNAGYNVRGFYSLANYFYKNREEYINQLQKARFEYNGRLQEFVCFSLKGFLEELEEIQDEILDFVRIILFRNLIEGELVTKSITGRQYSIVSYLAKGLSKNDLSTISFNEFKAKKHFISLALYEKHKSNRTLSRDIQKLLDEELIVIEDGEIKANINIMNQF